MPPENSIIPSPLFISFANQWQLDDHGWAQLAPFGDFPGQALVRQPDGTVTKAEAVQRLDRATAEAMVAKFKSPWQRMKRYFTGCPIYVGHPDVPAFANTYPDKLPKGMIVDLRVETDGLYARPVFTPEGSELVESRQLRAFSAYWSAREIATQTGAQGQPLKVYAPDLLKSAGLTNHPNLPVHLLNESPAERATQAAPAKTIPTHNSMNPKLLIDFLAAQGISFSNEATEAQLAAALTQLGDRLIQAETTLASRAFDLAALQTELANERQFHADTLLDHALQTGAITAAQRPGWSARLAADFTNEAAALTTLPRLLKTVALTHNSGVRKAEIANVAERRDTLEALLRRELAANGGNYDSAFAAVQKANPALFQAMKQPLTA